MKGSKIIILLCLLLSLAIGSVKTLQAGNKKRMQIAYAMSRLHAMFTVAVIRNVRRLRLKIGITILNVQARAIRYHYALPITVNLSTPTTYTKGCD